MKKKSLALSKAYQLIEPGPVVMVSSAYKGKTNIMTMAWHTMMEFEPPLIGCVISEDNYSFNLIKKAKECVINIPTVEITNKVVGVGSTDGDKVDKWKKFSLTQQKASYVDVPMVGECYANLECVVVDTKLLKQYNFFIFKVVKAWISTSKKRHRTIHHSGNGVFIVDGEIIKIPFKIK